MEAKLALKKSKRKDYYKILGIDKNASTDDIKKAYRKRAMVHHPGKRKGHVNGASYRLRVTNTNPSFTVFRSTPGRNRGRKERTREEV